MNESAAALVVLLAPVWLLAVRAALPEVPGLNVAPDPIVLAAALVAMRSSPVAAALSGALLGFVLDLPSGTPFGLASARLSALACALACARGPLSFEVEPARTIVVFFFAIGFEATSLIALEAGSGGEVATLGLLGRGARIALATALLAPIAWPAAAVLLPRARRGTLE